MQNFVQVPSSLTVIITSLYLSGIMKAFQINIGTSEM